MYHCSSHPNLAKGIIHGNWLTSIQGCKRFAVLIHLYLEGIRVGINLFVNLEVCWISVVDFGRSGGPKLTLVQELSRWWELGIDWGSSECKEGKLQIGTAVLSMFECMLHWFHTWLCKSIGPWIVRAWGLMSNAPRGAELSELGSHILRTIVRVKDFQDFMLWEHFLEQLDNFDSVALARWKISDEDHLGVEVTAYEVVSSFQGKDVWGGHLPWVGWSWHRSEGYCSILGLEPGAGLTSAANFFNGFVYTRPEDTSTCEQLGFGDSLMELV